MSQKADESQRGEQNQQEQSFAKCFEYNKQNAGRGSQTRGRGRGREDGIGAGGKQQQRASETHLASRGVIEWAEPSRVESSVEQWQRLAPSTAFQFLG